jgi:hypothetical protein
VELNEDASHSHISVIKRKIYYFAVTGLDVLRDIGMMTFETISTLTEFAAIQNIL